MSNGTGRGRRRRRITTTALAWAGAIASALSATLAAPAAARADQVVLTDGDRLTGHIVTLDAGKLTVNVPGVGDVKVDADHVAAIATDGPVTLKLIDGTTVRRRVEALPGGGVQIDGGLVADERVPMADIAAVNVDQPVWTGSILAGALLVRGNSDTDSLSLGANVQRKTDQDDVTFAGSYLYGRTKDRTTGVTTTTEENWQAEGRYDYNFTKRVYGFLDAQVRKDRIAALDLRVVPSGGFGYKFFDQPDFTLAGELGLAWVYERYTNNTPTREDVSVHAAYHVTRKFNDKVSAFHDLEYLPSIERGKNYIVNTDLGLHAQLTKHFFGEAKITLDYDSEPARGALKTNVFYAVNLGYNL